MLYVLYDEASIVAWLNANAVFSRQTVRLDVSPYCPPNTPKTIQSIERSLPQKIRTILDSYDCRSRGSCPWHLIDYSINSLDELYTVKKIMESEKYRSAEMAYRDIFDLSMIRCEVFGRTWYIHDRTPKPDLYVTISSDVLDFLDV